MRRTTILTFCATLFASESRGFALLPLRAASPRQRFPSTKEATSFLLSVSGSELASESDGDSTGNQKDEFLVNRERLVERLEDIASIQATLKSTQNVTEIEQLGRAVTVIEKDVAALTKGLVPPYGLSKEDFVNAVNKFMRLPLRVRVALCMSLGYEDSMHAASSLDNVPGIISKLYRERSALTQNRLKEDLDTVLNSKLADNTYEGLIDKNFVVDSSKQFNIKEKTAATSNRNGSKGATVTNIFGEEENLDDMKQRRAEALLARVTRKEGREATEKDLKTLLHVLSKDTFMVSETDKIPGGYILRGTIRSKTSEALMQHIEDHLPMNYPGQVCYLEEFTMFDGTDYEPVLVLLNKDMSPGTNGWLLSTATSSAVLTAFLFAYGVYGGNDEVTSALSNAQNNLETINWFNAKVLEVLIPMFSIQLAHELGHYVVSKKDGIKTSFPTLLPCFGLPWLSSLTSIRESPKNLNSLADFALAGPMLGSMISLALFVAGMQMTNLASPDIVQYFPTLPVDVIKISTLGGSIVDYFAGGEGYVTSQDPSAAIPLHPFVIAGFTGLVINSLEMLPLGATDGGRLSLSVFGRKGHALFSGFTWVVLIFAAFFVERTDAIVGAWVVFSIAQSDGEVPCKNEVSKIDPFRAGLAFAMWFFAALVVIPL